MIRFALFVVVLIAAAALFALVTAWKDVKLRRRFDAEVGLDLDGLVRLLPADLQDRHYISFWIAPWSKAGLRVALVYRPPQRRDDIRGHLPHVGIEFAPGTAEVRQFYREGLDETLREELRSRHGR